MSINKKIIIFKVNLNLLEDNSINYFTTNVLDPKGLYMKCSLNVKFSLNIKCHFKY